MVSVAFVLNEKPNFDGDIIIVDKRVLFTAIFAMSTTSTPTLFTIGDIQYDLTTNYNIANNLFKLNI